MNHCISEVTRRYLNRYEKILEEMMQAMEDAPQNDSISHNFIVQMIPHHQGAIAMSENVLKYVQNRTIRALAQDIIEEQRESIADMKEMLPCCSQLQNTAAELSAYQQKMQEIMQEMFEKMRNALQTNRIDEDFLREMLPHHEGAVQMSENTLQYPICEKLKPQLEEIIKSQREQIQEMRKLLQLGEK